jgi:hypothetical protein
MQRLDERIAQHEQQQALGAQHTIRDIVGQRRPIHRGENGRIADVDDDGRHRDPAGFRVAGWCCVTCTRNANIC